MFKVSVVVITYLQAEFIAQTLKGILMQKCSFPVELIISNDCSPDNTDEIIQTLLAGYTGDITVRYHRHEQNIGMIPNFLSAIKKARGTYIAICEGDDYWTDETKLQRQADFLTASPAYSLVTENALVINTITGAEYLFNTIGEGDIQLGDLLVKRQFTTASVLFRAAYLDDNFYSRKYAGDTFLWCYLATKGRIKYVETISSVYRRGLQGIVESTNKLKWAKMMEAWNREISAILPLSFEREIFSVRNYDEFIGAFLISMKQRNYKNGLVSLGRCFRYKPVQTLKDVLKYSLGKV